MQKIKDIIRQTICVIASCLMLSCWISSVFAQEIPHFVKYQGDGKKILKEIEKGEEEKDEGEEKDLYTLTFRIYNIETGGVALWKETHLNVPVKKRIFEVLLGSFTPLDLKFDEDYWLSVEIDTKGEIEPRERMTSFGYAYMSDDSYKLGGRYVDDFALFAHSHIGKDVVSPVAEAINADTVDGLHADQIGGIRDHGLLKGLSDDDHLQYLSNLRGDERYAGAGWDGLTKLKNAQDHIADKNNPHFVTLEQLGHIDNNPEEEAPTATERGEPTGTEIQGWADDIMTWGHTNLVTNLNADMLDGFHATGSSNPLPNTLLALGADGKFPASVVPPFLSTGLWTDAGPYIYPNNAGNGLQILDEGHLMIAGSAGIIDPTTANPKGTLTVGQSLAGNNIDYSLVIARHGTNTNPGTYSHTAPALLVQDFSGGVPLSGPDKDGLVRINAYRIGDATPNASNVTLLNVTNDEGEALRVDGLRNTFIGYGQKYITSPQTGGLFVDGSVGIGTTDPGDPLHIVASGEGEGGDEGAFMVTTSNFEFRLYEDRNTPGWTRLRTTAGNGIMLNAAAPNTPLGDYPMLAINATGNVGIGTMTPRNLMQVKSSQPRESIVEVTNDDPNAIVGFSVSREGWAQSGFLQYYGPSQVGGSGSELLQGDSVVIGSATGVTNGIRIIAANNGTHSAPIIFATGLWYAAAAERMRITSSGNVGIGTAAPNAKLHVNKDSGANHTEVARFVAVNPGAMPYITVGNSNTGGENAPTCGGGYFAYDNPTGALMIGEHCNQPAIIVDGGNVSIGTAVHQGTLDVNGAIYQRGSLLHADYVFEPNYKLESIEEHADYMWQEKHLKAVPKAAKAEDGQEIVEVGARNKGVLEELEKAHIYIAQLNERIKQLEAKLAEK